jgi:DNA mismatch repair protein MSH6
VQIVCKYLLTPGACPKSYGPTVARAAGVPESIALRAVAISDQFEASHNHAADSSLTCETSEQELEQFHAIWAGLKSDSVDLGRLRGLVSTLEQK